MGSVKITLVILIAQFYSTFADKSTIVVQTKNGPLQGIVKESRIGAKFVSFQGVRYASPVVRFQAPERLAEKWTTPKLLDTPVKKCAQISEDGSLVDNEDCLFLNVHVPQNVLKGSGGKPVSVMFWIHGGAFAFGDGASYGADYFMDGEDVILITVNYRLGIFGYLNTEDNVVSSNNALRDLTMALQWVHDNIAEFHGDPSSVTIFGESAGAVSVHYLLMSPSTKGLFHRAILQSGVHNFWGYGTSPRETAIQLANYLNCQLTKDVPTEKQSIEIRKCFESKNASELVLAQTFFYPRWPQTNIISRFLPSAYESTVNPFFVGHPQSLNINEIQTNYPNNVPVLIGVNCDEGSSAFGGNVLTEQNLMKEINENWNEIAPRTFNYDSHYSKEESDTVCKKIRDFYFGSKLVSLDTQDEIINVYSDSMFFQPFLLAAEEMAASGLSVYPFLFCHAGNWSLRQLFKSMDLPGKVGHADELQYLFPHDLLGPRLVPGSTHEDFSKLFVQYWVAFAKTGKPSTEWAKDIKIALGPIKVLPNSGQASIRFNFDFLEIDNNARVTSLDITNRTQFWINLLKAHPHQPETLKTQAKKLSKNEL